MSKSTQERIVEGNIAIEVFKGNNLIKGNLNNLCDKHDYNLPDERCECYKGQDHFIIDGKLIFPAHLQYHTSWEWLMPVVEKIEKTYDEFHGYFGVHICGNVCSIQGSKLNTTPANFHPAYMSDPNAVFETKIESTWYNVVQFIKWYNTTLTTTGEVGEDKTIK